MKKEDIYLDISKLTKEQQDEIIEMLPKTKRNNQYDIDLNSYYFLSFHKDTLNWWVWSYDYYTENKREITYEQFKELYPSWYVMSYKNYRFLTLEEMEEMFEKDERGSFILSVSKFSLKMHHLLGKEINEVDAEFILNNEDGDFYKLTSNIDGDLEWIFSPDMITNEPLPIKDDDKVGPTIYQPTLEQSIKELKQIAEKLNLKVSITFE